jgi:hypothetical protein
MNDKLINKPSKANSPETAAFIAAYNPAMGPHPLVSPEQWRRIGGAVRLAMRPVQT